MRAIYDPEPDSKGRIFVLRIGTDHSVYDLEELIKEYLTEGRRQVRPLDIGYAWPPLFRRAPRCTLPQTAYSLTPNSEK